VTALSGYTVMIGRLLPSVTVCNLPKSKHSGATPCVDTCMTSRRI